MPIADTVTASPETNWDTPANRFVAWELNTAEPSYTFVNELELRFGIVTTIGSTTKEPTTVSFAKPVFIGFAAEVTLYCPAFT